jgi:cysteine synthase
MMKAGVVRAIPAPFRTPLLRRGDLWIKAEACQRGKSAKYRMVVAKVRRAREAGEIIAGATLVEVTSGSTGVALAHVGEMLGLAVELHAYRTIASSKRSDIEERGARLVLHPEDVPVARLLEEVRKKVAGGGYWHLDQYARGSGVEAYEPLGREIVGQLADAGAPAPREFVCPVGSGGLIQGVGAVLRKEFPGMRVIAVEPEKGEAIDGVRNTELFHLGENDPYDPRFPDEVVRVARPKSRITVQAITLGESASAACAVAAARKGGASLILAPD